MYGKLVGGGNRKESCEKISQLPFYCDGLDLRSSRNLGVTPQHMEIFFWIEEVDKKEGK